MSMLQLLERRRFLSASIVDGTLTITGTDGDDVILVTGQTTVFHGDPTPPNQYSAVVSINGATAGEFDLDEFNAILIDAGAGNDRVRVYQGFERLPGDGEFLPEGLAKNVVLHVEGNSGNDTLGGTLANDTLVGGAGNDIILGGAGHDYLTGGAGNDRIDGGRGDDLMIGGAGNDAMNGGASGGADGFVGGAGVDTADYSLRRDGVVVTLDGVANDGHLGTTDREGDFTIAVYIDPLLRERDNVGTDVENVLGTAVGDVLIGDDDANLLIGGSGDDRLIGDGGNDSLYGHAGRDHFDGGLGADLVVGGSHLRGDAGGDLVDYRDRTDDLSLSLDGVANDGAACEGDQLLEIERVMGGKGDDLISGTDENDDLYGYGGSDTLRGAAGNDRLEGDNGLNDDWGHDWLEGGAGNDVMIAGHGVDTMLGNAGNDTINVNAEDSVVGGPGEDVIA